MPVGGEAFGQSLSGFFGGPKMTVDRYLDILDTTQGEQAQSLRDLAKSGNEASGAYEKSIAASTPEIQRLNADSVGRLGSLANKQQDFDEAANAGRLSAIIKDFIGTAYGKLGSYGEEADKLAELRMGRGGRGPSSYKYILGEDRRSKNLLPALIEGIREIASGGSRLNADRLANMASIIPTLQYRSSLPGATDIRSLMPYMAEAGMLMDRINTGGTLAEASKANVMGIRSTPNKWANFFQMQGRALDQGMDKGIDTGVQLFDSAMGAVGGAGGGAAAAAI